MSAHTCEDKNIDVSVAHTNRAKMARHTHISNLTRFLNKKNIDVSVAHTNRAKMARHTHISNLTRFLNDKMAR